MEQAGRKEEEVFFYRSPSLRAGWDPVAFAGSSDDATVRMFLGVEGYWRC